MVTMVELYIETVVVVYNRRSIAAERAYPRGGPRGRGLYTFTCVCIEMQSWERDVVNVCDYVCIHGWLDIWIDVWLSGWVNACVCMNMCMYI